MTIQQQWMELADIKDELASRDWFMGTSGNLAIRTSLEPVQFLVTASGKDKRKRTNEDFLLVNRYGQPVEETHLKPSAETLLHCAIYNKTNARCSLHVHTVANNVVSHLYKEQGEVRFKGLELIKAFDLWEEEAELVIPIIPNYADIPKLAATFERYIMADKGAVLIHNHGITTWGKSGLEAKKILEAVEFLCQYELTLRSVKV